MTCVSFSLQGNPGSDGSPGSKGAPVSVSHDSLFCITFPLV